MPHNAAPGRALAALIALLLALVVVPALAAREYPIWLPLVRGPVAAPTVTTQPTAQATNRPTATSVPQPTMPAGSNPTFTGRATYYDATGAGACSFDPSPGDLNVAALNAPQFATADYCGAYVRVQGPRGSVVVRIVDLCPDAICTTGHLDLSQQAFAQIGDISQGIIPISWQIVSPAISGPVAYHLKDGSNQWWTAVQVRNHRNPIARFEYRTSGDVWATVPRLDYNYFVQTNPGMGPGPYTVRITDSYGNQLIDTGIVGGASVTRQGAAQFPPVAAP